jgi:hypothetical protein
MALYLNLLNGRYLASILKMSRDARFSIPSQY